MRFLVEVTAKSGLRLAAQFGTFAQAVEWLNEKLLEFADEGVTVTLTPQ